MAGQELPGMLTFNGMFPGPQLRLKPGDRLLLNLRNRTGQPINLHYHGLHVSPTGLQDNVFRTVADGTDAAYDVHIPDDHPGGLFWYHPHLHGVVGPQVYAGLAGALVIEGGIAARPDVAPLRKRTLVLSSVGINGIGTATPTAIPYPAPAAQQVHLVNGYLQPNLDMAPGETQFWQLVNIATSAYYALQVPGAQVQVVEEDGAPVWRTTRPDYVLLPPGKRFGLLVTAPRQETTVALTTKGYTSSAVGQWPALVLAPVTVAGAKRTSVELPEVLGEPEAYLTEPVAKRRIITLGGNTTLTPPVWNLNGVEYQNITPNDVITVRRGTVEEWVIANSMTPAVGVAPEAHPFHIHVNDFTIVERGTWDPVAQRITSTIKVNAPASADTVNVDPGHYIKFRTKFADFTGRTVFHCHILFHEDHGMMGVLDIVDSEGMGVGPAQKLPTQGSMEMH
jgi:suppressor of ftsI